MANEREMSVTERFDRVENRLTAVENRLTGLEQWLKRFETKIDVGFESVQGEFHLLTELVGAGFEAMNGRFDENVRALGVRLEDHERVLQNHDRRIITLERRRK